MIFFIDDWASPIIPPIIAFIDTIAVIIVGLFIFGKIIYNRINIGASFCHVDRIKQFIHLACSIVAGYQKKHGAVPFFKRIEVLVIMKDMVVIHEKDSSVVDLNKNNIDPKACERK